MEKLYEDSETGCCQKFDPKPWDMKTVKLKDKLFIKDRVRSFFHIPLNFGKVMLRNVNKIMKAKAQPKKAFMMVDENSLWGADVYISVNKEVPGAEMTTITGTFLTKVYEGPFKDIGKWVKDMKEYVKSKDKEMKKLYFFYTTCPSCAKHYGKNYVVLLAEI